MAKAKTSQKKIQIDKANTKMVIAVAVSSFLVVFALVASNALWTKMSFQNEVIAEKEKARDQIRQNVDSVEDLVLSYKAFTETPENVIGGSSDGNGDKDGDNAQIILDALPSEYDFPGLTTSLEKIVKSNKTTLNSIGGTDDEVNQSLVENDSSQSVEMPFDLSASGSQDSVNNLLSLLSRSIRPISIQSLDLSGTNSELELSISAKSYYQPGKTLDVRTKVVKQR